MSTSKKINWFSIIRILGLVLVLTYHFLQSSMPGGFIGVDIFFVFSGYLITSLIIKEYIDSNDFKLVDYYRRRFVRIFPPLLIMVVFTMPILLCLPSDLSVGIGKQASAALGFVTNLFEMRSGLSYENAFTPQFYVHTWTLSLEMLFYLLWPLILIGLYQFLNKNKKLSGSKLILEFRKAIFGTSLVIILISILVLQLTFNLKSASLAYYSPIAHIYPFFFGALVATVLGISISSNMTKNLTDRPNSKSWMYFAIITLIIIGLGYFLNFQKAFTFRVGLILTSILTAGLIIVARVLNESMKSDEPKILTFFADISYSMYLWHWPIWIAVSNFVSSQILGALISLMLTIGISAFVYYEIEPYFHGKPWPALYQKIFAGVTGFFVVASIFTVVSAKTVTQLEKQNMSGYLYQDYMNAKSYFNQSQAIKAALDQLSTNNNFEARVKGENTTPIDNADFNPTDTSKLSKIQGGVTMIGDSVMLGAVSELDANINKVNVDARGSRNFKQGYEDFIQYKKDKNLGKFIVIGLGVNKYGNDTNVITSYIDDIVKEAPEGSRLIFITPYNGRDSENVTEQVRAIADYERGLVKKYPYVTVVDWAKMVEPNKDKLSDGIHIGGKPDMVRMYLNAVVEGLGESVEHPAK